MSRRRRNSNLSAPEINFRIELLGNDRNTVETEENLRTLWKRLKNEAKKKDTACQREIRKTGGDVTEAALSPKSERVIGMFLKEQGQPHLRNDFDSDDPRNRQKLVLL